MTGQGRPRTSLSDRLPLRWTLQGGWWACAVWCLLGANASAADLELRVRLAWGDGAATRWQGVISLSSGELSAPVPLGIEADESGSMWIEDGALQVAGRSPRRYEGVDVTVTAPDDAQLLVQLNAPDGAAGESLSIPVADLVAETVTLELDEQDNRLVARRAPGDQLRVELDRDQLVCGPGESLALRVRPHELGISADTRVEVVCELRPARADGALWRNEQEWNSPARGVAGESLDFDLQLPDTEGVYDVVITARRRSLQRLGLKQTVAERRVQLVVIDPGAAPAQEATAPPTPLEEIDPTAARWWERLTTVPLIPGIRKGPMGSGDLRVVRLETGAFVELAANDAPREISWEAYLLPVKHPGQPHVLEVEFPSNVPQQLGISVIEPNAAGAVAPVGLDSGVYLGDEARDAAPGTVKHRLIFWPRTKTPLVLMTNQSGARSAVYGKIRLSEHSGRLPSAPRGSPAAPERMIAAYYDRPLWPEHFGASEALDSTSGRSLKDWRTFYDGATRLVDHLRQTGRNGLIAPAWSDGCALYPSLTIESTPRYDNGAFFATAQDPIRKDVLELLFRLCDREGIQFAPQLDFGAPLASLEALKRAGGTSAVGLEWVNAEGKTWSEVEPSFRGQEPYYNAIDPRVQQAMLAVVSELTGRYGHHPSFAGLAVQLSAHGYAQLPGPEWGMDEVTVAAFARDTGFAIPTQDTAAATTLLLGKHREAWLKWRAERLASLHREMQQAVLQVKPSARVFLTGAHLLEHSHWEQDLQPSLSRSLSLEQLWLRAGIAPEHYLGAQLPLLLRPTRLEAADSLSEGAINLEMNQAVDIDRRLERLSATGAIFYHEPRTMRVHDFERQSPFKSTYCWLISQPTPVGAENRRRFVHALAGLDAEVIVDGGWTPPTGDEDALRDVIDAYRNLPAARFVTVPGATQPIIGRTHRAGQSTYLYLVNDSPWPVTANVALQLPPAVALEGLAARRTLPVARGTGNARMWTVELAAYDLVAVRMNSPQVAVTNITSTVTKQATDELARRVNDVWTRAKLLRNAETMPPLANADFEAATDDVVTIPDWFVAGSKQSVALDPQQPHAGKLSVRLTSDGDVTSLISPTFASPQLGRLQVRAWLRAADANREAPLQVVVEGLLNGEPFERRMGCGTISDTWIERQFEFTDLPPEGVEAIRVRFEMLGAGQVWVDDVSLVAAGFRPAEMAELAKILQLASDRLDKGQLRDCQTLMEGYWPQFIERCAPMPSRSDVNLAERPPRPQNTPPPVPPKPGLLERINRLMPSFVR